MLHVIQNPVEIDIPIRRMQERLFTALIKTWNITDDKYECYGRCYRNEHGSGFKPDVYVGKNEYQDVFAQDTTSVQSFFGVSGRGQYQPNGDVLTDVHLVFFTDLSILKPSITYRADVEVRKDVYDIIKGEQFGFTLKEQITGVQDVLKEYAGRLRDQLKYSDMHPYHYFRYNMTLRYNPNECLRPGRSPQLR